MISGAGQLQDLHTKLNLNHPQGQANQLHKCIASAANARGVFDGNVKVCMALHRLPICSTYRQDNTDLLAALSLGAAAPLVSAMHVLSRSRGMHDQELAPL